METMFERIKNMTKEEMKDFIYWVYLMGNEDGYNQYCDSPGGYFGGHILGLDKHEVMPNDSIEDLLDKLEEAKAYYNGKNDGM